MNEVRELSPGDVVGERYEVQKLLGKGGMGAVYLARHRQLHRQVALKVLLPKLATDVVVVRRFIREARAAASIGHPGIVEVFDLGRDEAGVFLAMERLEGEELLERIRREHPLPLPFVRRIVAEIADAVQAAHEAGIIHRDLKPQNVFLARRGRSEDVVKVLDFGIAKLVRGHRAPDGAITETGEVFGTPVYMSPEQLRGEKDLDARADVYALGAILYQAITGRMPFSGKSLPELVLRITTEDPTPIAELRSGVPESLVELVARAMTRDRTERIPTAAALRDALEALSLDAPEHPSDAMAFGETLPHGSPSTPRSRSLPEAAKLQSASWSDREGARRRRWIGPALVVLGLVGVGAALTFGRREAVSREEGGRVPLEDAGASDLGGREGVAMDGHATRREDAGAEREVPERVVSTVEIVTVPAGAEATSGDLRCTTPCELAASPGDTVVLERRGHRRTTRVLPGPLPPRIEVALDRSRPRTTMREPSTPAPPPLKAR